jgi:hypothetical protein
MIFLKSTLAGLLTVLAAAIVTVIVIGVYLLMASRSSGDGAVGWDPIAVAKPLTWLVVVLGIFSVGFFWEFFRVSSN